MPVTPITTDVGSVFVDAPAVTIKTATSLAGPWTLRENLYLDQLRDSAGPAIGQAELTYEYGTVMQPDAGAAGFVSVSPLDVDGHYVWISIENIAANMTPPGDPIPDWYGIIEVNSITPRGIAITGGITSGVQRLIAYDLKRIMERYIVTTSAVEDSAASNVITINKGLNFNADDRGEFPSHGNRSTTVYPGDGDEPDAYAFSYQERGTEQWSAEDAVNYLLTHIGPKMLPDVNWYLEIGSGNLAWNPRGNLSTDRKTFKSLIDDLINRHRGVGYRLVFTPDAVKPSITVTVFSYSDSAITMSDGTTFEANPDQYSLDFEQSFDVVSCNVSNKKISEFHSVVAEGAWRTSTCTMRVDATSDQLIADWTNADETAYADAASGEAWYSTANREAKNRANKTSRADDKLASVYRRFRVSDDWDLESINPEDALDTNYVFPQIDHDVTTGLTSPLATDEVWIPGLKVLDKLPLRERYDYSGSHITADDWKTTATVSSDPPFLRPFTFMKTGSWGLVDTYEMLERIDGDVQDAPGKRKWSINTRPHHDRAAITLDVQGGPQHFFALTDFTSQSPLAEYDANDDPAKHYGLDWSDALVTLTFAYSERVYIKINVTAPAAGEQERVLRISLPDCRLDYVVPNTVVGIVHGALQLTDGGFVRDDRERLWNTATAASIWYGKTRQTLNMAFKQVRKIVGIGDLIVDVGPTYQKTGVNSVVTAITYDMHALTTQFETSYAELDMA